MYLDPFLFLCYLISFVRYSWLIHWRLYWIFSRLSSLICIFYVPYSLFTFNLISMKIHRNMTVGLFGIDLYSDRKVLGSNLWKRKNFSLSVLSIKLTGLRLKWREDTLTNLQRIQTVSYLIQTILLVDEGFPRNLVVMTNKWENENILSRKEGVIYSIIQHNSVVANNFNVDFIYAS